MKISTFRVATSVFDTIAEASDWYEARLGKEEGDRIENQLFAALDKIRRSDPMKSVNPTGFPRNYRRQKSDPYVFYYRFNLDTGDVLVYLLRHQRQRPYTPATHQKKATEAEHDAETWPNQ